MAECLGKELEKCSRAATDIGGLQVSHFDVENWKILTKAALNENHETQARENGDIPLEVSGFEEGNIASNDFSNFTSLTLDNDFDLDYMQWITGLEAEQVSGTCSLYIVVVFKPTGINSS